MARSVKAPVAAWLACAGALVLLCLVAYEVGHAAHLDASLLRRLMVPEGSARASLAETIAGIADLGPVLLLLAAACSVAYLRGRPAYAAAAIVVVAGANITTQVLKILLAHPRYAAFLGPHQPGTTAFPSGHVTGAASIAIAFALVASPRWRPVAAAVGACLVAAVGLSVMALGWHFPSDVVGGILVASGWGFAVLAVLRLAGSAEPQPPPERRAAISVK